MTVVANGPDEPTRWFFVHLQKTGGTALFRRLQHHFPRSQIYPDASDGDPIAVAPQLSVDVLLDRWPQRRADVRVLTGHFPLCTTDLLPDAFVTLTILRDPVERTLSYLRHHRALTPADADKDLEAIYDDPFRFRGLIHEHMTKMLGLRVEEMAAGALTDVALSSDHLERALANLDQVAAWGVQERFEPFCEALTQRFGWDLGPPQFANRTRPAEVSSSFRARIARENPLDVELYARARDRLGDRPMASPS